jgi:hypothetical protein
MTTERAQIFAFIETFYKDVPLAPEDLPAGQCITNLPIAILVIMKHWHLKICLPQKTDPKTFLKYYNITH